MNSKKQNATNMKYTVNVLKTSTKKIREKIYKTAKQTTN